MMPVARRVLGETHEITLRTRKIYAQALYNDPGATLDDLREAATTLEDTERTARRVFGGAHPLTVDIERALRQTREPAPRPRRAGVTPATSTGVFTRGRKGAHWPRHDVVREVVVDRRHHVRDELQEEERCLCRIHALTVPGRLVQMRFMAWGCLQGWIDACGRSAKWGCLSKVTVRRA